MKKKYYFLLTAIFSFLFLLSGFNIIKAKEIVSQSYRTENIFSTNITDSVTIFDTGDIEIIYKYGLRKVEVQYCEKGANCDQNIYSEKSILESNEHNSHKGEGTYSFNLYFLDEDKEYRIEVSAYVASNSEYVGNEEINNIRSIYPLTATSRNVYLKGSSANNINDKELKDLFDKITEIVNKYILPVIFFALGLLLVIKGAILGVEIVKSADNPGVRAEKVGALKWLVIGVAVAYLASGVITAIINFLNKYL